MIGFTTTRMTRALACLVVQALLTAIAGAEEAGNDQAAVDKR